MRRAFTILCALSLLVFVAVVALWVRSYFVSDALVWRVEQVDRRDGRVWNVVETRVASSRGWWSHSDVSDAGSPGTFSSVQQDHADHSVDRESFMWETQDAPLVMSLWVTRFGGETPVPYWLTALALAVLPLVWVARRWARRRVGRGFDVSMTT